MAKQVFETFDGCQVTDAMLTEAACLFNENYGMWGMDPANFRSSFKKGESHKDRPL